VRRIVGQRVALATVAVASALGASGGAGAANPTMPSIYVHYLTHTCTFTLSADGGVSMTSAAAPGPTLPPGTYELEVTMLNPPNGYPCGKPRFTLSGPGVGSVVQFVDEEVHHASAVTLQPGATYVAEDASNPGVTRRVFTTAASGSSASLVGGSGSSATTGPGSVQGDLVGSARLAYRGKLAAAVGASGKASLRRGGLPVTTLRAGLYDVAVADSAKRAGFFLRHGTRAAVTVTGAAYTGKRTRRLALRPGAWTFFSGRGRTTVFTVVA
jgi:hypothetical protein